MTVNEARAVLDKNAFCQEGSLRESLCEDCFFSEELFWQFYDCLIVLTEDARENGITIENTTKILGVYNRIIQMFMFHFDPHDLVEIRNFPDNYPEYLERLEVAVRAYLYGESAAEEVFSLQRPQ